VSSVDSNGPDRAGPSKCLGARPGVLYGGKLPAERPGPLGDDAGFEGDESLSQARDRVGIALLPFMQNINFRRAP